ncbi:mitochondrial rhodanese domain (RHOD)-containing protein I (thiosulfate sulfurtransferase) [Andalucia godoyi]|uniref:Mitochondrial rhodanese domain (RHOD)-containing protein I (Thiosulfate sulfurtransferase) n=1 Tax=Andalucia godoyi TaxID=505711 RepID=A0A8K0F106_ANDGO|nr:mitochondrial rhodanese domain (RHOD)-containing protein I (thiosulfate sulfurtransferase) [Andalucia godoyi]|eukprot:ANDGO_04209.mRNA.1 mitochondrial rhodanese domain (RHOD)-containing protein I (thiosulfate sulfurtransferase)
MLSSTRFLCRCLSAGGLTQELRIVTKNELQNKLSALKEKPFVLVDVRNPDECAATGVIGHAINIPLPVVESLPNSPLKDALAAFGGDKEVIVYCRSGRRSDAAAKIFQQMGFKDVASYKGSALEWFDKQQ